MNPMLAEWLIMNKPSPEMVEQLIALRHQLDTAAHGQAGALIDQFVAQHGRSKNTIWRWVAQFGGYRTNRKKRNDAGTTRLPEQSLSFIAATKSVSVRANGIATKPTGVAMNIAHANNIPINISASQINRLMRQRKMDAKSQAASRNHIQMQSRHPNHVHEIDPSLCLVYYLGKRQMMMTEAEFNKNKPTSIDKVQLKVWRYVRYDHASGSLDVRYFEAAGENQRSLFDFLLYTWGAQTHRLSQGVPKMLYWDKGSANTSAAICRLLDALGVDHQTHATHHAWAKGGVENGNRIVEMHFESRLRDQPVNGVDELNASAEKWVRDYNANAITHVDSRIVRASGEKLVRDELWQLILRTPEALIKMPERKVCAWFLTGRDEPRQITDNLISYVHPEIGKSRKYNLSQWSDCYSQKDKVQVSPLLLADGAIRVSIAQLGKDPLIVQVEPIKDFTPFGFQSDSPVFGESYAKTKDTIAEKTAKHIAATAYGPDVTLEDAEALLRKNVRPFQHLNEGKGIVSHSHLGQTDLPTRLIPSGNTLDTPAIAAARGTQVEHQKLNHIQAAKWLQSRLGPDWRTEIYADLQTQYPTGATEPELQQTLADLQAGRTAQGKAKLRAV